MLNTVRTLCLALLLSMYNGYAQIIPLNYDEAATAYQNLNFSKAEKIWLILADEGNANAQYALAVMHLKGEASHPDNTQAYQLLKLAAQQNHLTAVFNLGVAYWEGTGTEVNKAKALNWWEVAARGNDSGAQFNLGLAYYIGDGRPADREKAKQWINKAANNGHPQAPQLLRAIQREEVNPTASLASSDTLPEAQQPSAEESVTAQENVPEPEATPSSASSVASPVSEPAPQSTPSVDTEANLADYWQSIDQVVSVRARPSATAIELKILKPNTPLKQIKTKGEWMKVEIPGNYAVWVHGDFINHQNGTGTIKGTNVNVRPLPEIRNPDAAPVGRVNTGDKVKVLLARDQWVKVVPEKALPAWIQSKDSVKYRASKNQRAQEWVKFSQSSPSS